MKNTSIIRNLSPPCSIENSPFSLSNIFKMFVNNDSLPESLIYFPLTSDLINKGTGGSSYDAVNSGVTFGADGATFDGGSYIKVPKLTTQSYSIYFEIKTNVNSNNGGADYQNDYILGSDRPFSETPSDLGIGVELDGTLFTFNYTASLTPSTDNSIEDGEWHSILITFDNATKEISVYMDNNIVQEARTVSTESEYVEFESVDEPGYFILGKASRYENYLVGNLKNFRVFDSLLTDEERDSFFDDLYFGSVLGIGSSLAKGFDATDNYGWLNRLGNLESKPDYKTLFENASFATAKTEHWITYNYSTRDEEVVVIGLSLGNETGTDVEKKTTYQTNYPTLVSNIVSSEKNVIACTPYSKGDYGAGDSWQETKDTAKWMENNLSDVSMIVNHTNAFTAKSGGTIPNLMFDETTHPNDTGHKLMLECISKYLYRGVIDGTFDRTLVPKSITNTTSWFKKVDTLTQNPIVINTPDVYSLWNLEFDIKCDSDLTGKTLMSTYQDSLSTRLYVDADNGVKFTDGTTVVDTGITASTLDNEHRITLRFHAYDCLRLYVDGVFVDEIDYLASPIINTTALKVVLGGLYNDNSSDALDVYFRNVVLHRTPLDYDRIAEGGTKTYIVEAGQEFYNDMSNLSDLTNKSQTDTTITINDSNIIEA